MTAMLNGLLNFFGQGPKARAYIRIRGNIYEGAYHLFIEERVREHGLKGWMGVHHLPMHSYLEMEVEGTRHGLDKLLVDFQKGPATAKISAAEVQWKTYRNEFQQFRLRA